MIATAPAPKSPVETPRSARASSHDEQSVLMRDVGWSGYETLLELRGERRFPRMVYLDGNVWLMTTSFPHEQYKVRVPLILDGREIGRLVVRSFPS